MRSEEFIPMAIPEVRWGNEAKYLAECIAENFVSTTGRFVGEFETAIAKRMGTKDAVSTVTGTAAIHLGLIALGVTPGDLVIAPTFTFIATANAVAQCGASLWLFDVDETDWTLSLEQVREGLQKNTHMVGDTCVHRETGQRVAAILSVHVLGTAANMSGFQALAKEHGLPLIADGACAIGVKHQGKNVADFADLTTLSFNGNKTITSGGGGMLVGNDQKLMQHIRHLSTTARVTANYDHDEVGYNYRITNLEAAVGLAQEEQLDRFLARKNEIRHAYNHALNDIESVRGFPPYDNEDTSSWLSGVVFSQEGTDGPTRLIDALRAANIESRPFWKPIHLQKPYANMLCEEVPISQSLWQRIVTLPSSVSLSPAQQDRVIQVMLGFLKTSVEQ